MGFKLLSYPVNEKTPSYGGGPTLEIRSCRSIEKGDVCNTYSIIIPNHLGTHIDAPKHFFDDGRAIWQYKLDELIFDSPAVVSCPKEAGQLVNKDDLKAHQSVLESCDVLLIATGFSGFRGHDIYTENNPGISPDALQLVRSKYENIRCVGIDSISISPVKDKIIGREAHRTAFRRDGGMGNPLLIIEDISLEGIDTLRRVFVLPWGIMGVDSCQCVILAEV